MAVVVEQTIPFSQQTLDLENPERWNKLFPLLRPSVQRQSLIGGQTILIDTRRDQQDGIQIVALSDSGCLSSTLLSDTVATAIVNEQKGKGTAAAEDVANALQSESKVLLLRSGKQRRVLSATDNILDVEVGSDLEFDHILSLLGHLDGSARSNFGEIHGLVKEFLNTASAAHSSFHSETVDSKPAIEHAEGQHAYEEASHAVEEVLSHALRAQSTQAGSVTFSVHFADVNGLSRLEGYILGHEIAKSLNSQSIPFRLSSSMLVDHAKPARGFSISICPVSQSLLAPRSSSTAPTVDVAASQPAVSSTHANPKMTFNDAAIRARIISACEAVVAAEPTITKYDEIVGDGDCGFTLRDGARKVVLSIQDKDLSSLPKSLSAIVDELEINMGGTSGALYCIYLTALASALSTAESVPEALFEALQRLMEYTRARLGDRTMLDALIPFADMLRDSGDVEKALEAARDGVERTKELKASLGRSTYLDESATKGVPDPGAYGLLVLLEGMCR